MRKLMPSGELARDERFVRITIEDVVFDPRNAFVATRRRAERLRSPGRRGARHRPQPHARHLRRRDPGARGRRPHLLGLRHRRRPRGGRRSSSSSTWPASAGTRPATSRSPCKLSDHMGSEIGEFAEQTLLYEAACNADPVLRLTGVNRALEGLAIDVFNTMRDFGDAIADPVLVLLRGLDAGRRGHPREDGLRLAAPPHRQRPRAPASRRSTSSARSTSCSASAASAARKTRTRSTWPASSARLAGFTDDEISELVDVAAEAYAEAQAMQADAAARRPSRRAPTRPAPRSSCSTSTTVGRGSSSSATGSPGVWALGANWLPALRTRALWWFTVVVELAIFVQVGLGVGLVDGREARRRRSSTCSTASSRSSPSASSTRYRAPDARAASTCSTAFGGLFLMGLGIRALLVGAR